jgi:DNA repair exonuclease SbcCD ATPase subunit
MNTSWKSPKVIAGVATVLVVISMVGIMNMYRVNTSLQGDLNSQRLRSESLLSEKLLLEKDLDKFRTEMDALKGVNADLDKAIAVAASNLRAKEEEYKKLQQQSASYKNYKKQYEGLVSLRKELEQSIENLTGALARLEMEKRELRDAVANLEQRNSYLQMELQRALLASVDQPRIETLRGRKEKLTVVARRTKKMKVNVEVPSDLREVSFRIRNDKGQILSSEDGTIASRVIDDGSVTVASADGSTELAKPVRKMEMVYHASKKLEPGIYTVEILSENLYVGSMQVKLK